MVGKPTLLIIGGTGELGQHTVAAAERLDSTGWGGEIVATYRSTAPPVATVKPNRVTWSVLELSDHKAVRTTLLSIQDLRAVVYCAVPTGANANARESPDLHNGIVSDVVHCAEACALMGVRFIAVSTDLVYDGLLPAGQSYKESDTVSPVNAYGRYKAEMERRLGELSGEIVIARCSLILSLRKKQQGDGAGAGAGAWEYGKGIRFIVDCLQGKHGEIDIFTDERRCMAFADDLGKALVELCHHDCIHRSGIVHLAGDECSDRWELTKLLAGKLEMKDGVGKFARSGLSAKSGLSGRPLNCELSTALRKTALTTRIRGVSEVFKEL